MRRVWAATNGIRLIALCWMIGIVGMVCIIGIGCGGSSDEVAETPSYEEWEIEEAERGYYYGNEAARIANELCEEHIGVQQVVYAEGLELVVCEDGEAIGP